MEVDNVLCVSPLHRNGKWFKWVKGEGHEASNCVVDGAAQQARLDLKLQQARVPGIEPKQKRTRCCYHCHLEIWTAGNADRRVHQINETASCSKPSLAELEVTYLISSLRAVTVE